MSSITAGLLGLFIGCTIGVSIMCLLQINPSEDDRPDGQEREQP